MSQPTLCKNQFSFKLVGIRIFLCWFDMEWPYSHFFKMFQSTKYNCTLGRPLITRLKERQTHCKYGVTDKSAVAPQTWTNNHCIDWDSSSIIDREERLFQRRIKEALHIRRMNNFNKDHGLAISSIWNGLELWDCYLFINRLYAKFIRI